MTVAPEQNPGPVWEETAGHRGAVRVAVVEYGWPEMAVLAALRPHGAPLVFANFIAAGVEPPAALDAGDDLYESAPPEVRAEHSLHAVRPGSVVDTLRTHALLRGKDAEVWAVPRGSADDCLAAAKLFVAWLARPSVLDFALRESPPEFCEQLLVPFRCLLIPPPVDDGAFAAWAAPGFDPAELGLGAIRDEAAAL